MTGTSDRIASTPLTASQKRVLPGTLLRDDEVVRSSMRPHPLFILLVPLEQFVVLLAVFVIQWIMAAMLGYLSWFWSYFVAGVVLAVVARIAWACLQWYNELYLLTNRRVLTRRGVIRVKVYETSLEYVRQTLVRVSLRERVFGLGTVLVATAATAANQRRRERTERSIPAGSRMGALAVSIRGRIPPQRSGSKKNLLSSHAAHAQR